MRQVGSELWIGNALDGRDVPAVLAAGIEAIVDLAIEESPISATRDLICCRVPLLDGEGNPPARLQLAIEIVQQLLESETPTLLVCSAGMSRSPAVAAAALSRLRGLSFEEALRQVADAGPLDVSPRLVADLVAAHNKTPRSE